MVVAIILLSFLHEFIKRKLRARKLKKLSKLVPQLAMGMDDVVLDVDSSSLSLSLSVSLTTVRPASSLHFGRPLPA